MYQDYYVMRVPDPPIALGPRSDVGDTSDRHSVLYLGPSSDIVPEERCLGGVVNNGGDLDPSTSSAYLDVRAASVAPCAVRPDRKSTYKDSKSPFVLLVCWAAGPGNISLRLSRDVI